MAQGELITFIGKELVSKEIKDYKLVFKLNGTRLSLVGFKGVENE